VGDKAGAPRFRYEDFKSSTRVLQHRLHRFLCLVVAVLPQSPSLSIFAPPRFFRASLRWLTTAGIPPPSTVLPGEMAVPRSHRATPERLAEYLPPQVFGEVVRSFVFPAFPARLGGRWDDSQQRTCFEEGPSRRRPSRHRGHRLFSRGWTSAGRLARPDLAALDGFPFFAAGVSPFFPLKVCKGRVRRRSRGQTPQPPPGASPPKNGRPPFPRCPGLCFLPVHLPCSEGFMGWIVRSRIAVSSAILAWARKRIPDGSPRPFFPDPGAGYSPGIRRGDGVQQVLGTSAPGAALCTRAAPSLTRVKQAGTFSASDPA